MSDEQAVEKRGPANASSIYALAAAAELTAIDLVQIRADRIRPAKGQISSPDATDISLEFGVRAPRDPGGDGTSFLATVKCEWREKGSQDDPYASIGVMFRLAYNFSPDVNLPDVPERVLLAFGDDVVLLHAWPFLRERVRTLCGEMQLPTVVMPLKKLKLVESEKPPRE